MKETLQILFWSFAIFLLVAGLIFLGMTMGLFASKEKTYKILTEPNTTTETITLKFKQYYGEERSQYEINQEAKNSFWYINEEDKK